MSKKNREARKQEAPTFTKAVTLPGKLENVSTTVVIGPADPVDPDLAGIAQRLESGKVGPALDVAHPDADEPPPAPAPMTPRETALAVAAIVEAAMTTFGHRYPFRLVERLRGLDVYFGVPGAPERFVESLRQDMARQMPGVTVNGKRRG